MRRGEIIFAPCIWANSEFLEVPSHPQKNPPPAYQPNGHGNCVAPNEKLAMPVSLSSILSRKRARKRTNRCASFTLREAVFHFPAAHMLVVALARLVVVTQIHRGGAQLNL
jgi:hypothetical protein